MTRTVSGARVLITGAASGMGRLYAERAVAEGAKAVILWDRDAGALTRAAGILGDRAGEGTLVVPYVVDIADLGAIAQTAQRVRTEVGDPDIVINNAGIVRGAFFWEHDNGADTRPTMQINALAPMYIAREFLPAMMANRGRASRIVNIASAAGMLSNPRMSVYAASKAALIGWGDSLRLELKQQRFGHVKVTTVCPSYISTGMFEGARGPLLTPVMTPEYVVERVWQAMLAGKPMLTMPWTVVLSKVVRGLLPLPLWDVVAGRVFGVYGSMDKFTGRP
ncbi:SDR family NAD(P)-dependent oxidoreductase [Cryobacterium sp. TMT1-62]|uniref:SDR family NAD(P)-dependent oxidoreductase n=1 Tax=Cryobacterium sandaracinum TaxID=1259247 RepID=A0ABY2J579_9MICO|nr:MULTISPECIES: SDR family NAD(P)-dependent oxidoreductase [Cryobacterium]TFB56887.1 SDR family NAD(P)-dependent oxidoreductase [Cryobacterium sp. Sr3]TFB67052.1 SDR family NAD(P)-dependent oxidoreductase [Cryobacterium sp. Hz7]TFC34219.1 SDR family NAD(P)-dependent oxidoreductase [Cryobacterium sp. TMT2-14]TFC64319.1 SDR family NAD(P)-dependent oxidoreductase [Cryobacterium sp. TMT2-4]TFD00091.1 SDR family NAD(P)-dependent oxidoreductase [Cryobacterium sandaracinum]